MKKILALSAIALLTACSDTTTISYAEPQDWCKYVDGEWGSVFEVQACVKTTLPGLNAEGYNNFGYLDRNCNEHSVDGKMYQDGVAHLDENEFNLYCGE